MVDRVLMVVGCVLIVVGCGGKRGCRPMENEQLPNGHDMVVVSEVIPGATRDSTDQRSSYNRFLEKNGSCVSHTAGKTVWRKS